MTTRGWIDRWLDRIVNIAVLGIIAFALFRPEGWIGKRLVDWRQQQVRTRIVAEDLALRRAGSDTPVLVEFLDYQCPFCQQAEDSMRTARARAEFVVQYRHLPLTAIHPKAEDAALVAICAEGQGIFAEIHQLLFSSSAWVAHERVEDWPPIAESIPDPVAFADCLAGSGARARLESDIAFAESIGVRGTPSFASVRGVESGLPTVERILRLANENP